MEFSSNNEGLERHIINLIVLNITASEGVE
jgi:hypothetical protein